MNKICKSAQVFKVRYISARAYVLMCDSRTYWGARRAKREKQQLGWQLVSIRFDKQTPSKISAELRSQSSTPNIALQIFPVNHHSMLKSWAFHVFPAAFKNTTTLRWGMATHRFQTHTAEDSRGSRCKLWFAWDALLLTIQAAVPTSCPWWAVAGNNALFELRVHSHSRPPPPPKDSHSNSLCPVKTNGSGSVVSTCGRTALGRWAFLSVSF